MQNGDEAAGKNFKKVENCRKSQIYVKLKLCQLKLSITAIVQRFRRLAGVHYNHDVSLSDFQFVFQHFLLNYFHHGPCTLQSVKGDCNPDDDYVLYERS